MSYLEKIGSVPIDRFTPNYTYYAEVKRWVDADTVDLIVDLGFEVKVVTRFRLEGIDAWEVRGEEREAGLAAKEFCLLVLPTGSKLIVKSIGRGKYGRWLGILWETDGERPIRNINMMLIDMGHAEPYPE